MVAPMRRKERMADEALGYEILAQTEIAYLAARTAKGELVQRSMNPVLLDDWLFFHGSHAGEKVELEGEGIVSAHRVIAEIPSYFVDPELACPATTYYESVEVRGELEVIEDASRKDAVLTALMEKYQPEGGYERIDSRTELYKKQVLATRVFGFRIAQIRAKLSVGQDRPAERVTKVVAGLWRRGLSEDLPAIERVLRESPLARPEFLRGPEGTTILVHATSARAEEHASLLAAEYWRTGSTKNEIVRSILGSNAWIGLSQSNGELIAAGRALTDGAWTGVICDVVVAPAFRGRGHGEALMRVLLDHPRLREVRRLRLGTRDAASFYEKLGFRPSHEVPLPFPHTEMIRVQGSQMQFGSSFVDPRTGFG
jgi:GNAT superfamily N-acetyltransferase/nitroimidazol reductase NimA-like FMN-containing flavoprotein (pyridoxamine 5'-phosphate oxidase superfamily)